MLTHLASTLNTFLQTCKKWKVQDAELFKRTKELGYNRRDAKKLLDFWGDWWWREETDEDEEEEEEEEEGSPSDAVQRPSSTDAVEGSAPTDAVQRPSSTDAVEGSDQLMQ